MILTDLERQVLTEFSDDIGAPSGLVAETLGIPVAEATRIAKKLAAAGLLEDTGYAMKKTARYNWQYIDRPKTEGGMRSRPGASTVWQVTSAGHAALGASTVSEHAATDDVLEAFGRYPYSYDAAQLASLLGLDQRRVQSALRDLQSAGLLTRQSHGRYAPSYAPSERGWREIEKSKGVSEPRHTMNAASRPSLSGAVHLMRLYLGSVDFASVRDQQRLYNRVRRAVERIASSRGADESDAWAQIEAEAKRQGILRPVPGQHV